MQVAAGRCASLTYVKPTMDFIPVDRGTSSHTSPALQRNPLRGRGVYLLSDYYCTPGAQKCWEWMSARSRRPEISSCGGY